MAGIYSFKFPFSEGKSTPHVPGNVAQFMRFEGGGPFPFGNSYSTPGVAPLPAASSSRLIV